MPKRRRKTIKNYELEITNKSKESEVGLKKQSQISRPGEPVVERVEPEDEKIERDKKLFMWVGVSCLMVVFFIVWIFSLKYEFKVSLNKGARSGFDWNQTKIELDKAMTQVKQGLAEIKKIQAGSNQIASSSEPKLTAEQIDLLKGKLLNEVASSMATSTRIIKNQ